MEAKESIKRILSENNPIAIKRRSEMRRALTNSAPSFLCPNCIGGLLFHDLGLQFRSPTVNLMMYQTDFVKFVLNLDDYLEQKLIFFKHPEYSFPCAHLGDIAIHFTHYRSEEEATHAWRERSKRIDRDNLFVFLEERDGLTKEDILRLGSIHACGLVVFTANAYPDIPYALQIQKYERDGEVGNILRKSYLDEHHLLRVNSATTSNQKSSITDPVKVLRILKDKLQGNDALYPIAYSRYIYMLIRQGTQRRWQEESSAARACLKKELVSGGIWKFCSSGKLKLMALAVVYALPLYRLIYRCRDKLIGASKKYDV